MRYSKEYPEWTSAGIWQGNPLRLILAKSADWCYEREFRIIGSCTANGPAKLDSNYVKLPDGAITAIVLGCENREYDEISGMITQYAPGTPIKRIVRQPDYYRLKLQL
ncbi:MAG TPA: hypothetical protein VIY49_34020 [Bryobacteraceae bacterium]